MNVNPPEENVVSDLCENYITGGLAAISGWLDKAIIIYLLIAGFQNAREATRVRKEIKGQI